MLDEFWETLLFRRMVNEAGKASDALPVKGRLSGNEFGLVNDRKWPIAVSRQLPVLR